jgi:hypothetical protein
VKAKIVIRVAILTCLLLSFAAFRPDISRLSLAGQASAQAQSIEIPSVQYRVVPGAASGGGYNLSGIEWQVSGSSSGGKYLLHGPSSPSTGTPCCCSYLPCVRKN